MVADYEPVKEYKRLEAIVLNDEHQNLLKDIKKAQKALVNAKYFKKDVEKFQEEYNIIYDQYFSKPSVVSFFNAFEEVLELLNNICNIIEQEINVDLL